MQIGSYNPLTFLSGSAPATGKADDADARAAAKAAADAAGNVTGDAAAPEVTPEQEAAGVLLTLKSDATGGALAADLVYGNVGKTASTTSTDALADADTEAMAQRYSQAMANNAGNSTSLSVDANGVLLAKPVSAGEAKAQAFVHNAVNAMRDFADAQERQKTSSSATGDSTTASAIPRSLADVQQKLAARFKMFS